MTDDLVKRLRDNMKDVDAYESHISNAMEEAADRIETLEKRVQQMKIVFATMRSEMISVCATMKVFEDE